MIEVGGVSVLVAFLAGLVSCLSPCVLPLAPVYAGNLASGSLSATCAASRRAPVLHAVAFMAGFTLMFTALGVSVGLAGYILRDQLSLLQKAGGVFLIVLGLHMSRLIEIPAFYRGLGATWEARAGNPYLRSFLVGSSISAGWLPCIGPTLGTILTLAITSGTVVQGGVLLLVYSLGLAVPFVAFGATLARTPGLLRWLNRHHDAVRFVAGVTLIVMGIVLFTGTLQRLNGYFRFSSAGLGAQI
ncbi:MAG: cytochrome c biogenesis protein CcdA [Burkholderiales bacterium]|nr:cytochrome c biogenesis protein CcdA [Burkholderiales bacterium]